ncbi:MAG: hypothetical protein GF416_06905 [Candidatus Altiarchaeales archaeon]|nr:hypothetical protein [Candidatus Altiarchaeales archaeon]MBD3416841.1 hypothetical protein [Candidatus Altiarchaeales archaeon]
MAEESTSAGESASTAKKKKSKRKRKKTTRKKTTKHVSDGVHSRKSSENSVSIDTLLAVILVISLIANFVLFLQNNSLRDEVSDLKGVILEQDSSGSGAGSQGGGSGSGTQPAVPSGDLTAIILNDERCSECDTTYLETRLEAVFPGIKFVKYDYSSADGKKLYKDTNIQYLPAVLFTDSVKSAEGYSTVQQYLVDAGNYLSLRIGAQFDPAAEICDNGKDDTGNGKVDCEDETCAVKLVCREEKDGKLDVFVMSQCPYGTRALDAMKEVLEAFPEMDFDIHYIASYDESSGTFNALHGQPEVDENIRQLCVMKYYPDDYEYMEYIWCRNPDITSTDWEGCATDNGMDAEKIKECAEGEEGKQLLIESIKLPNELGIGASPTWLANNRYDFGGITPEAVRQKYCQYNEGLDGCEGTAALSNEADVPAGGCG